MRCDNHCCAEFVEFLEEMHDAGGNPVIDVASRLISIEYLRSGDYSLRLGAVWGRGFGLWFKIG